MEVSQRVFESIDTENPELHAVASKLEISLKRFRDAERDYQTCLSLFSSQLILHGVDFSEVEILRAIPSQPAKLLALISDANSTAESPAQPDTTDSQDP